MYCLNSAHRPRLSPFWEDTLVQKHANCIHLVDWCIEMSLEVSMSSEGLADVPTPSIFGVELYRFEVSHIVYVRRSRELQRMPADAN